ncbi:MAG: dihydrofolate reductase family protein, partial [Pseudomonadota bacterium]
KIARIVTAFLDPDERVDGKGHAMMAAAGIEVCEFDWGDPVRRVMAGYLASRSHKKPYVSLKLAMTPDGIIGTSEKGNLRISGTVSNRQTHLTRARHDAILVGTGTAIADDPSLNCRLPGLEERSPLRVVLDFNAKIQAHHKLVATASKIPTLIAGNAASSPEWLAMLRGHGVQFLSCESHDGQVALPELLDDLHSRGIQSVMVEGGARLATSFLDEGLVDEIILHVGGNPELPGNSNHVLYAPFNLETLPDGFDICQTLKFGEDQSCRLLKREV